MQEPYGHPNSVIVTCLEPEGCNVYFEPWGSEYRLQPGDWLVVTTDAVSTGQFEVSYSPGAISLGFTAGEPVITNGAGGRIQI